MSSPNSPRSKAVLNGPSKEDLILALFSNNKLKDARLRFSLEETCSPVWFNLLSVERKYGGDQAFMLQASGESGKVQIYYHTGRRSGTVTFLQ